MAEDIPAEIARLRQQLAALEEQQHRAALEHSTQSGTGAVATTGGVAAGASGAAVGGDVNGPVIVAGAGVHIVIGDQPIPMTAVQRESAMGRYLSHVISRNRYLQLQGIRSGGRLVNIELEHMYITLKATRTRTLVAEETWLATERQRAPGEWQRLAHEPQTETVTVKVEEALAEHTHLVVLGDPGSGKTTLLRYLALCYGRDCAESSRIVQARLGLAESGFVPILLPLRNLGAYLKTHYPVEDGTEGHARLLAFLRAYLQSERITVPDDFFDTALSAGRAVLLFDGMDEVGDADLRRRVARLIEDFASACPGSRLVVTSRIVGYTGAARLGEAFATTTIRDFTLADVREFLTHWHRLVSIGQMGPGEAAEHQAIVHTQHLLDAIQANPRVRELAINPLMLTVIALVHRDRVTLPERRAELYAEAVEVLLGKWDEARGVEEMRILDDRTFDSTDRRLLLQAIALGMHEAGQKDIAVDDLRQQLRTAFASKTADTAAAERATDRFLTVVKERTGLLVEAGQGVYRFSHLTFQEYLAAVQMAEREDYVAYALGHTADPFWRETLLLAAGYLSTKNPGKTTRLITAIAEAPNEPELFHNLVLAAECMRDVGPTRVEADVVGLLTRRLRTELDTPVPTVPSGRLAGFLGRLTGAPERRRTIVMRRLAAATAMHRIESGHFDRSGQYWSQPYGEPEWVTVPAGEFWMGSDEHDVEAFPYEKPVHRLFLPDFQIARTPITNAQYLLYVEMAGARPPDRWEDGHPPKDTLDHPVVHVSWHDAWAYCRWLSQVTGKSIRVPTEAEWEKAARGDQDTRCYPWGDTFDMTRCNSRELGIDTTTLVGLFPAGASPYGCLDMAGNVWEWTCSLWGEDWQQLTFGYPYDPHDGREDLQAADSVLRVLRGGGFWSDHQLVRCAYRHGGVARAFLDDVGFRVRVRS